MASAHTLNHRVATVRRRLYRDLVFRRSIYGYLFVLPALAFLIAFSIYPTLNGFYLSLTEYSLLKPPRWVGLENYTALVGDALYLATAKRLYLIAAKP